MKNLIVGDKPTVSRLADRLKRAGSHAEYQRIQCVLIRATLGSSATQIAQLLGWSTATVHVLHSRWAKEGDAIFDLRGRGGRRHQYLSPEQEQALLAPFVERAQAGGMLTTAEIQQAYQEHTGKAVAPSTIYRLLARHGWRKVVPRPRHPKADVAAQAAFKKTPPHGTPRGLAPGYCPGIELLDSSRIPNRRMLEIALDPLGLPLNAAEVPGSGLHELQLGTRRGQFRDGLRPPDERAADAEHQDVPSHAFAGHQSAGRLTVVDSRTHSGVARLDRGSDPLRISSRFQRGLPSCAPAPDAALDSAGASSRRTAGY
jgi:transposase